MKFWLCLVIVALTYFSFTEAGTWIDDDTVIVDAFTPDVPKRFKKNIESDPELEERNIEDDDTILVRSQRCRTRRGEIGQCTSLKECYPILFAADPEANLSNRTLNDELAAQLMSAHGLCRGVEYRDDSPSLFSEVVRSEVFVCCVPQSRNPPPLPPPTVESAPEVNETTPSRGGCGLIKIDPSILPPLPSSRNTTGNGEERDGDRIVNGREAKRGEFPWIVALMNNGREFCGGSLIDTQTVLTAAHCVQHMKAEDVQRLTIQIGDHDIYSTSDGRHEVRTASRILYHRGFSMKHLHHDVALIRLNSPISETTYIRVVCMHSGTPSPDNVYGDVAGWGQLRDGGPQPSKLQTANVKIWTHSECSRRYEGVAPAGIGEGMVCSGGDGKDSCRGDSGGPLTMDSRSQAKQVGIVSWGVGCGSYPGVYTRVSKYTSWINKNSRRG